MGDPGLKPGWPIPILGGDLVDDDGLKTTYNTHPLSRWVSVSPAGSSTTYVCTGEACRLSLHAKKTECLPAP